jgi:hypothetical protein
MEILKILIPLILGTLLYLLGFFLGSDFSRTRALKFIFLSRNEMKNFSDKTKEFPKLFLQDLENLGNSKFLEKDRELFSEFAKTFLGFLEMKLDFFLIEKYEKENKELDNWKF